MVVAGDFKNGITFDMDGAVFQVVVLTTSLRVISPRSL